MVCGIQPTTKDALVERVTLYDKELRDIVKQAIDLEWRRTGNVARITNDRKSFSGDQKRINKV